MQRNLSRRASLAGALAALSTPALAQPRFPDRPLRIILPGPPGGLSDGIARFLAETMYRDLGQPVVVENKPGANGILATDAIARSRPDGYTIGYMFYAAMTLNPLLIPQLSYRMADFQLLTPIFKAPQVLVVGKNVPARNVREFVDHVKQQGTLSYGTLGNASTGQIVMETLRSLTGIDLENVGYRGEAMIVTDMVAGNLPAACVTAMSALEQHRAGNVKIIGMTTPQRLETLPDLPTFTEAGFPVNFEYFHGLAMPAGTPRPIFERVHGSIVAALRSDALRARYFTPDMRRFVLSPADFETMLREETAKLGELVQARGIRLE